MISVVRTIRPTAQTKPSAAMAAAPTFRQRASQRRRLVSAISSVASFLYFRSRMPRETK